MRFKLREEYITLQQLLKACDVVASGGEAKIYLMNEKIYLNGVEENRRGKKIRSGDVITNEDGLRIEVE